jgi:ribosomal protein S18 acetylase RimI-like enzyme
MEINIRPMTATDKPPLMEILKNTPEFVEADVKLAEEVFDDYLEKRYGYLIMIAEVEGKVAGYICYGATPLTVGTWDIYWMATARELKGKGIGTALMKSAETDIRAKNGRLMMIETSGKPVYENTRAFHIARGFREAARIRDFYEPGDDLVLYEKRFNAEKEPN